MAVPQLHAIDNATRHGRNLGWLLAADMFGKAVSVVFFAYLSRKLSIAQNGWYGTFIAYVPILLGIIALGLPDIVTRDVARRRERLNALFGSGLTLQTIMFLCVGPAAWAVSYVLKYPSELQLVVILASIAAFERAVISLYGSVLNAYEQFKYLSLIAMTTRLLTASGSCIVLYLGFGLTRLLYFIVAAYAVELLLTVFAMRRVTGGYRFDVSITTSRWLAREGAGMAMSRFASVLFYMADVPLLNVLATPDAVGLYAIGSRFLVLLWTFADKLEDISYPILSRKMVDTEAARGHAVTQLVRVMALAGFPMAVGMAVLARPIVLLLCGERYLEGAFPAVMLTAVLACEMLARIPVVYLRAAARPHIVTWCYVAGAAMKLALGAALIPRWGITPFLIVTLVLAALIAVALLDITRRAIETFSWRDLVRVFGGPALASILMAIPVWALSDLPIVASIPAGVVFYVLALWSVGVIKPEDKQVLRNLLRFRQQA